MSEQISTSKHILEARKAGGIVVVKTGMCRSEDCFGLSLVTDQVHPLQPYHSTVFMIYSALLQGQFELGMWAMAVAGDE